VPALSGLKKIFFKGHHKGNPYRGYLNINVYPKHGAKTGSVQKQEQRYSVREYS
jgi:hypothetical protein